MEKIEIQRVQFADLKNFCGQAYRKVGVPEEEAEIVADLLVRSDLRGVETHGVTRLPIYIQRLQKGFVRKESKIAVVKEKGSTAFLDAHGSMGRISTSAGCKKPSKKPKSTALAGLRSKTAGTSAWPDCSP